MSGRRQDGRSAVDVACVAARPRVVEAGSPWRSRGAGVSKMAARRRTRPLSLSVRAGCFPVAAWFGDRGPGWPLLEGRFVLVAGARVGLWRRGLAVRRAWAKRPPQRMRAQWLPATWFGAPGPGRPLLEGRFVLVAGARVGLWRRGLVVRRAWAKRPPQGMRAQWLPAATAASAFHGSAEARYPFVSTRFVQAPRRPLRPRRGIRRKGPARARHATARPRRSWGARRERGAARPPPCRRGQRRICSRRATSG